MDDPTLVPEGVLGAYGLENARIELLSGGRTNRTLRVRAGRDVVMQQMLGEAHSDLLGIMENLVRVTTHLDWRRSINKESDSWYPILMTTIDDKPFVVTDAGDVWRAFNFREGRILRSAQPPATMVSAASMYGRFSAATADLGGPPLIETAPGFHDIDRVAAELFAELESADAQRRAPIEAEMVRLTQLKELLDQRCANDGLDELDHRVVHNDTKISNVLFDSDRGNAIAVLDLDLAMMGPVWHDFGDLMRSVCWYAPAGEPPQSSEELFSQIAGAFVAAAGETALPAEIATFATAGPRLSLELGLRYLTDHLRDEPHLQVEGLQGHLRRGLANVMLAEEMLSAYDALRLSADEIIAVR